MNEKVSSIVVTFNRLDFLKEILNSIRNQSRKPDSIIVVNNSSTDGTVEWLSAQSDLIVVHQPNVGSSGGQYAGIKTAYEMGFDWLWIMDDDVVPDNKCLEKLLKSDDLHLIRTPLRFAPSGMPYLNDCIEFNLTNPFKSFWTRIISRNDLNREYIFADGITFEGPVMHRSVVENTGFPEFGFFIYGDDTDYFIRTKKAGFQCVIVRDAKMNRKLEVVPDDQSYTWKQYYIMRNIYALDVMHGNFAVRMIRPFAYFIKFLLKCKTFEHLKITLKAFNDGYFYKSKNKELNKS